jgi:hypothetical protein
MEPPIPPVTIDFYYVFTAIVHLDPSRKVPLAFRDCYFRHSSNCHDCGASIRVSSPSFFFLLALSSILIGLTPRH